MSAAAPAASSDAQHATNNPTSNTASTAASNMSSSAELRSGSPDTQHSTAATDTTLFPMAYFTPRPDIETCRSTGTTSRLLYFNNNEWSNTYYPHHFHTLLQSGLFGQYMQRVLHEIEVARGINDYHLVIRPRRQQQQPPPSHFFVLVKYGRTNNVEPSMPEVCMSCDTTDKLFKLTAVTENTAYRTALDAKGRDKLIFTPIRHIRRLSEQIEAEWAAFTDALLCCLKTEAGSVDAPFQSLICHHGSEKNHDHLHWKLNLQRGTQIWSGAGDQQLAAVKELLKDREKTAKYGLTDRPLAEPTPTRPTSCTHCSTLQHRGQSSFQSLNFPKWTPPLRRLHSQPALQNHPVHRERK